MRTSWANDTWADRSSAAMPILLDPSVRVRGAQAILWSIKDRTAECEPHCPVGDREPVIGTFRLLAFNDGILEWEFRAPADAL